MTNTSYNYSSLYLAGSYNYVCKAPTYLGCTLPLNCSRLPVICSNMAQVATIITLLFPYYVGATSLNVACLLTIETSYRFPGALLCGHAATCAVSSWICAFKLGNLEVFDWTVATSLLLSSTAIRTLACLTSYSKVCCVSNRSELTTHWC